VSVVAAGLTVTVTGPVVVLGGWLESVPLTVTVTLPGAVGVPLITQFAPSVRPAGSVPAVMVQV
jgi:hypothetical protein